MSTPNLACQQPPVPRPHTICSKDCVTPNQEEYLLLHFVISVGQFSELEHIIAHDQTNFANNDKDEHERRSELNGPDLGVKLDQPDPS